MVRVANVMLSPGRGGMQQSAADWHHALQAHGNFVFSVGRPNSWFCEQIYADYFIPFHTITRFDPTGAFRLRRAVWFADVVILHGNRGLAFASQLGGKRTLFVAHNSRAGASLRNVGAVAAVSEAVRRDLSVHHSALDFSVIPNLIRPPYRAEPRARDEVLRIGAFGRHHAVKGFDILLRACATMQAHGLKFRLVLGGDGPETEELKVLVQSLGLASVVEFPGWISDKRAFLTSLDVFVLPSRNEPFGISLIEAMAYGLPVIASKVEGPAEIVTDGFDGLLVGVEDAAGLAEALLLVAESADYAHLLGARGAESSRLRFGFDAVSARMDQQVRAFVSPPVAAELPRCSRAP